jgi:hypothetical protein
LDQASLGSQAFGANGSDVSESFPCAGSRLRVIESRGLQLRFPHRHVKRELVVDVALGAGRTTGKSE